MVRPLPRTAPDHETTGWPPGVPFIIGNEGCGPGKTDYWGKGHGITGAFMDSSHDATPTGGDKYRASMAKSCRPGRAGRVSGSPPQRAKTRRWGTGAGGAGRPAPNRTSKKDGPLA